MIKTFYFTFAPVMKTKLLIWVAILSIGSMSRVQAQSDVDVSLKSDYYDVGGLSVTYLSLSATKDIQITKSFALPLFGQVIANPASQNFYFVFGFTVKVL